MYSGFYTAASGMLTQQRTINVLSNNLLNADTPGFRSERVITTTFEQEMVKRIENGNSAVIGNSFPTRIVEQLASDFGSGALELTDRPCDMAINGNGYFLIQGEDNIYLTRNGSFSLDSEGYLELFGVGRVLGETGEIHLGNADFVVTTDAYILDENGRTVDRIYISAPAEDDALQRAENGLYVAGDGFIPTEVPSEEGTELLQFAIEKSNVNFNRELSLIMQAQRNFQACSTILKGLDEISYKSATQIASI